MRRRSRPQRTGLTQRCSRASATCFLLVLKAPAFPSPPPSPRHGARETTITSSPCHLVTLSPRHLVTLSPCHLVTLSPCHLVTLHHSSSLFITLPSLFVTPVTLHHSWIT